MLALRTDDRLKLGFTHTDHAGNEVMVTSDEVQKNYDSWLEVFLESKKELDVDEVTSVMILMSKLKETDNNTIVHKADKKLIVNKVLAMLKGVDQSDNTVVTSKLEVADLYELVDGTPKDLKDIIFDQWNNQLFKSYQFEHK